MFLVIFAAYYKKIQSKIFYDEPEIFDLVTVHFWKLLNGNFHWKFFRNRHLVNLHLRVCRKRFWVESFCNRQLREWGTFHKQVDSMFIEYFYSKTTREKCASLRLKALESKRFPSADEFSFGFSRPNFEASQCPVANCLSDKPWINKLKPNPKKNCKYFHYSSRNGPWKIHGELQHDLTNCALNWEPRSSNSFNIEHTSIFK